MSLNEFLKGKEIDLNKKEIAGNLVEVLNSEGDSIGIFLFPKEDDLDDYSNGMWFKNYFMENGFTVIHKGEVLSPDPIVNRIFAFLSREYQEANG